MYTLKELRGFTGASENTIFKWLTSHKIPYQKNNKGRVIVELSAMVSYRPRNNRLWLAKMAASHAD